MENIQSKSNTIITYIKENTYVVELNRPKSLNALSMELFLSIKNTFDNIHSSITKENKDIRCVILKSSSKQFSSGLDLKDNLIAEQLNQTELDDPGRIAFRIESFIELIQMCVSSIEKCPLPVISLIDGFCLGGATSLITACDIRLTTKDAKFSIKEIDIAITADIGVLQRMGKQTGNESLFKQYSFTGEIFNGNEAKEVGLVSKVFSTYEEMEKYGFELSRTISAKSPVAVWGVKKVINYSRDNKVDKSLEYVRTLNSSLLQSKDLLSAMLAGLNKNKPTYPKF